MFQFVFRRSRTWPARRYGLRDVAAQKLLAAVGAETVKRRALNVIPAESKSFYDRTRGARKVIVVDPGFLGDTVHLIPALWEIKDHYPGAELHLLSSRLGCEVARLAPCVDQTWPIELDPAKRTIREQWSLVRRLRRERFDVAFNFSGADRSIFLTALTGAPNRVAYQGGRRHFWNRWLAREWILPASESLPIFEQHRRTLTACGFSVKPPRFDLRVNDADRAWAAANAPRGGVHFSLNSANPLKEWPVEHYATLIQSLLREYPTTPMLASASAKPREQSRVQALAAAVADARLTVLPPGLTIGQLAGVLEQNRLHFGPDSGVLHLALALGVPTASLFRDLPGLEKWSPALPGHRRLVAACACAGQRAAPCEAQGRAQCLARISPAQVDVEIAEILRMTLS